MIKPATRIIAGCQYRAGPWWLSFAFGWPGNNFLWQFSHSTSSFKNVLQPFICMAVLSQMAWLSISHPSLAMHSAIQMDIRAIYFYQKDYWMHETCLWFCDKHPEVHGLGVALEDRQERSSEQMPHHGEWICHCQSQHALLYQARILTLPLFFYCLIPWIGLPCSHLKKENDWMAEHPTRFLLSVTVIKVYWLQVHYQKIMAVLWALCIFKKVQYSINWNTQYGALLNVATIIIDSSYVIE